MLSVKWTVIIAVVVGLASTAVVAEGSNVALQDAFSASMASGNWSLTSAATALRAEWASTGNISSWNISCFDLSSNLSVLSQCLQRNSKRCLSLKDMTSLFNMSADRRLSQQDVIFLSPALLYSLLSCNGQQLLELANAHQKPKSFAAIPAASTWGYSMLFVTLINMCSLAGAVVIPCMKMRIYKRVLMFLVSLAVGTLAGSGLLFLIPEAFLLAHDENSDYVWKASTIMGGIYLFYITEKIMRMVNARRENNHIKKQRDEQATAGIITTSFRRVPIDNSLPGKDPTRLADTLGGACLSESNPNFSLCSNSSSDVGHSSNARRDDKPLEDFDFSMFNSGGGGDLQPLHSTSSVSKPASNGHSHQHPPLHLGNEVAPVAYMIIFGDALHNFIDGLSIGSAFTQSLMTGISVSVAVMCEELPHELGDFAILLNSGMKFRKALMYNFLSACTCYLGTIVGILLAENTESHEWIFAVAGGMFLYISLVDMMPEMNSASETEEGKQLGEMKTFMLQNCGLLTGYAIMLLFALYGRNISFA